MSAAPLSPVVLASGGDAVRIIDQRRLPAEFVQRDLTTIDEVVSAITSLAVRGAPAIGWCAAAGLVVVMRPHAGASRAAFLSALGPASAVLAAARPTAVNLAWAVSRCVRRVQAAAGDGAALWAALREEAVAIRDEDLAMSRAIAAHATPLLTDPVRVLTHCNTGMLATAGGGTALAPVYAAHAAGRDVHVYATETRPLLQGARLTAWELARAGISVTVLADGAAAALLRRGDIGAVLVGADRIAANGDVANKVGTYALAIAADRHRVPFYVLAPSSTVDALTPHGDAMTIEMRARDELAECGGVRVLPDGVGVWTPAFDVTPASLITAIITDRGVHMPPFTFGHS